MRLLVFKAAKLFAKLDTLCNYYVYIMILIYCFSFAILAAHEIIRSSRYFCIYFIYFFYFFKTFIFFFEWLDFAGFECRRSKYLILFKQKDGFIGAKIDLIKVVLSLCVRSLLGGIIFNTYTTHTYTLATVQKNMQNRMCAF